MSNWRDEVKNLLNGKLSDGALDLVVRVFALFKAIEDTAIRQEPFAVLNATQDVLSGFVGNRFFAKHGSRIYPLISAAYCQYSDAVQNPISKDSEPEAVVTFTQGINSYKEIAVQIAMLDGADTKLVRNMLQRI